jgi:opacity protein-like surface antigen
MLVRKLGCLSILSLLLSFTTIYAFDSKNLDFSLAVGSSWYSSKDSYTQPTAYETDTNHITKTQQTTTYRLGVGYHLFSDKLNGRKFFNDLFAQLNFSRGNTQVTGEVYAFGASGFNNFSFKAPVSVTELMLDLKPSIVTYKNIALYAIAGTGVVWKQMSFTQTPVSAEYASLAIDLPNVTTTNAAYELGLGVKADISQRLNVSFEYLSDYLGNTVSNSNSNSTQSVVSAPNFLLNSQSLLLGINWRV